MSTTMEVEYAKDKKEISYDRFRTVWSHTQPGLVYASPYAIFTIAWLKHTKTLRLHQLSALMLKVRTHIHEENPSLKAKHSSVTLGVSFHLWERLTSKHHVPVGMFLRHPVTKGHPHDSLVFHDSKTFFTNSKGDLWFHIKSDTAEACDAIFQFLEAELNKMGLEKCMHQKANSRTKETRMGKC
jgi:deferrochelatase/peroxidase EfeB